MELPVDRRLLTDSEVATSKQRHCERPTATLAITLSIAAVERDTGLSKDTLRIWERRCGLGCRRCLDPRVSFGAQTPLCDLVLAAGALRSNIVALSFSGCMNHNQVADGLVELRAKLSETVALWARGSSPVLHHMPVPGVQAFNTLTDIPAALRQLRRKG